MGPMPLTDALFLLGERREQPMHVGGLQIFDLPEGEGPGWLRDRYEEMIGADPSSLSPLFRRRAVRTPSTLGAWGWADTADVDLEHHVRHSALPAPGRVRELLALTSRLHGSLLDRHRPLWESHLIESLDGRRFAVYSKIHHSLLDGVSALRLLSQSLSADPATRGMPMPWALRPPSRPAGSGGEAARPAASSALRDALDVVALGTRMGRRAAQSFLDANSHLPRLGPRTILNQPITGARRFAAQSWPIERFRAVGAATATTINDVLLATCSGALRAYLLDLQSLPEEPLVAMTPVSLRQAGAEVGGNAVGALLCDLGTNLADPGERLRVVHESMEAGKAALRDMTPAQATVVSAVALAPMLLGQVPGLRRVAGPGYNLVVSNIPGPSESLYWNGARLLGVYPLSIPTSGQALNITATSYGGNLEVGLTGCRRRVPHLQRLLAHLEAALSGLEEAAGLTGG